MVTEKMKGLVSNVDAKLVVVPPNFPSFLPDITTMAKYPTLFRNIVAEKFLSQCYFCIEIFLDM